MGDPYSEVEINRLRNSISHCLNELKMNRWPDIRQWLINDGRVAVRCIQDEGPDLVHELKANRQVPAQTEPTPPTSPENPTLRKAPPEDDELSESGSQESIDAAGPSMVDQTALYDIRAILVDAKGRSSEHRPMSANRCKGHQSFIRQSTIELRNLSWCVNAETKTVILRWRATREMQDDVGDACYHETVCKVASSEQMGGVDVALAVNGDRREVRTMSASSFSSADTSMYSGYSFDANDEEEIMERTARMNTESSAHIQRVKRRRVDATDDPVPSRAFKGRRS